MTRAEALREGRARLSAVGVEPAADDARQILQDVLAVSHASLIAEPNQALSSDEQRRFEASLSRREQREPLSHILGRVDFWSLQLNVNHNVLTPRADTETLVSCALDALKDRQARVRILDIATGSGAIALALLSALPNAEAIATDISPDALALAKENANLCGLSDRVTFINTDWTKGVSGTFDLVVSNPPYIASDVIRTLDPEVRDFEPVIALDGGPDGLEFYPGLLEQTRQRLNANAQAFFEIGYDQGEAALALAQHAGFSTARIETDLAGRDRVLCVSLTN